MDDSSFFLLIVRHGSCGVPLLARWEGKGAVRGEKDELWVVTFDAEAS